MLFIICVIILDVSYPYLALYLVLILTCLVGYMMLYLLLININYIIIRR